MDIEKKAFIFRAIWPALQKMWTKSEPARGFLWGSYVPKWMYPVFGTALAAPFVGHALRERRKNREEYIKRLHIQRRLAEMGMPPPYPRAPLMEEAETAIGDKLEKTSQGPMPPGGMPGGTPGAGGPPMPPPALAGFRQQHPPPPKPMPAPPAHMGEGLDRMREHLRKAKARAGQRRKQRPGLDTTFDRYDKSLSGIMRGRRGY